MSCGSTAVGAPAPKPLWSRRLRSRTAPSTRPCHLLCPGDELTVTAKSIPIVRRRVGHGLLLRHRRQHAHEAADRRRLPATLYASRARSSPWVSATARSDGSRRSIPATSWTIAMRSYRPEEGALTRTNRSATRPRSTRSPWRAKPTRVVGVGFTRTAASTSLRADDGRDHYPHPRCIPARAIVSALAEAGPADARPTELPRGLADRLRDRRPDDLHQLASTPSDSQHEMTLDVSTLLNISANIMQHGPVSGGYVW